MKNFSSLLFVFLAVAALCANAEPFACPSIEAIRSIGFTDAERNDLNVGAQGTWDAFASDSFGTSENWVISLFVNESDSAQQAIQNGNKVLQSPIMFTDGPNEISRDDDEQEKWMCMYLTSDERTIFAVTSARKN